MNTKGLLFSGIFFALLLVIGVVVFLNVTPTSDISNIVPSGTTSPEGMASSTVTPIAPIKIPDNVATNPATISTPLPVGTTRFIVVLSATSTDKLAQALLDQGFITDAAAFQKAYLVAGGPAVLPGAYKLSTSTMSVSQMAQVLHGKPYMKWVLVPPGLRKEEIASLLTITLGWTSTQKTTWLNAYKAINAEDIEGVYFPDTYLIPVDESPTDVAKRFINQFNVSFAPYLSQFNAQNIKWTTGLTLASIVQREAANDADAPLIAGILWNRLDQGIALGVDATLQYARGDTGKGWWAAITTADKQIDSPYNTYKNKGLPPHPISNPGLAAIRAVLQPASTTCIYYLHDKDHVTHCANTYEEHQQNIKDYLQ